MFGKFLCFVGWHNWTWKYDPTDVTQHQFGSHPPSKAKCSRCGIYYGREAN